MVITRFVFDLTGEIENSLLAASLDVLLQSRRYGFLLCSVMSDSPSLLDKTVVEREIRGQFDLLAYTWECVTRSVAVSIPWDNARMSGGHGDSCAARGASGALLPYSPLSRAGEAA